MRISSSPCFGSTSSPIPFLDDEWGKPLRAALLWKNEESRKTSQFLGQRDDFHNKLHWRHPQSGRRASWEDSLTHVYGLGWLSSRKPSQPEWKPSWPHFAKMVEEKYNLPTASRLEFEPKRCKHLIDIMHAKEDKRNRKVRFAEGNPITAPWETASCDAVLFIGNIKIFDWINGNVSIFDKENLHEVGKILSRLESFS